MIDVRIDALDDYAAWRNAARAALVAGHRPENVRWVTGDHSGNLFAGLNDSSIRAEPARDSAPSPIAVPKTFQALAQSVCLHRDAQRHALLYRMLWRLQRDRRIIDDATDSDVVRLRMMEKSVRRDIHKMRAFLRFRRMDSDTGRERYAAWFEPNHFIERANAGFFVRRFAAMDWTIVTPHRTVAWDGSRLWEGPGGSRHDVPNADDFETLWRDYYRSTFNPARLKVRAMLKEMPKRYWLNMPEAQLIPELIAGAQQREAGMVAVGSASAPVAPPPVTLATLRAEVARCQRCPIHAQATQAVHGEGPPHAPLMIIGEQPGDEEDRAGRPFVGPAGQVLNSALSEAGIDREQAFVTNAVRHFKHEPRVKRRLHQTPTAGEIDHCRWWLDAERAIVKPRVILCLGASAARGVLGRSVSIERTRAEPIILSDGTLVCVTVHPSYLLRIDAQQRAEADARFVDDLRRCAALVDATEADTPLTAARPAPPPQGARADAVHT